MGSKFQYSVHKILTSFMDQSVPPSESTVVLYAHLFHCLPNGPFPSCFATEHCVHIASFPCFPHYLLIPFSGQWKNYCTIKNNVQYS